MNSKDVSRVDMYDVIHKICRNNYSVLSTYTPFVTVFTVFEDKLDELKGWIKNEVKSTGGYALDKNKRRRLLESESLYLSSKLYNYAILAGLDELKRRVKYAPYELKQASEKELAGISHQLAMDASDNLAGLAPYLIDAAWLTAFGARINDFLAFTGTYAYAVAERKKAREEGTRLVKEIGEWLRNALDPAMDHFRESEHFIFANYKNGRKIVNPGSRTPALKGKVTDAEGNPLKGLKVVIAGTQRKSITTPLGNFKFISLKSGRITVLVLEGKKEVARKEVGVPHDGVVEITVR
jgi:hypothetical protein